MKLQSMIQNRIRADKERADSVRLRGRVALIVEILILGAMFAGFVLCVAYIGGK